MNVNLISIGMTVYHKQHLDWGPGVVCIKETDTHPKTKRFMVRIFVRWEDRKDLVELRAKDLMRSKNKITAKDSAYKKLRNKL